MPRPMPFDHLKSRKKPVTNRVPIVLDSELADELAAAKDEYEAAKTSFEARNNDVARERLIAAEDVLKAAQEKADDNIAVFVFRSMGRKPFEDLVDGMPPTKAQKEEARKQGNGDLNWNPDSFPAALVAASCQEPPLSVEEAQEIWDSEDWNTAELLALFYGALEANQNRRVAELKNVSGVTSD